MEIVGLAPRRSDLARGIVIARSTQPLDLAAQQALWAALGDLLRAWWRVDRIRVSSSSGRLLRIFPPCLISIGDQTIEVVSRRVSLAPAGAGVCYECRTPNGPAELCVTPAWGDGRASVLWCDAGGVQTLLADEVQVWG